MTRRETLLDLAARCEAATGADRELDERIAYHTGHRPWDVRPPRYTASLDAALSPVPDSTADVAASECIYEAMDALGVIGWPGKWRDALPRFVTAAALRARAAMEDE